MPAMKLATSAVVWVVLFVTQYWILLWIGVEQSMLIGSHSIIFSDDAEATRAFLRDKLGLASVDAGEGWLIFAMPPSEVAAHPSDEHSPAGRSELYLMCDDVNATIADL